MNTYPGSEAMTALRQDAPSAELDLDEAMRRCAAVYALFAGEITG